MSLTQDYYKSNVFEFTKLYRKKVIVIISHTQCTWMTQGEGGMGNVHPPFFCPFFMGGGAKRKGCPPKGEKRKQGGKNRMKKREKTPKWRPHLQRKKNRCCALTHKEENKLSVSPPPTNEEKNLDFAPPSTKKKTIYMCNLFSCFLLCIYKVRVVERYCASFSCTYLNIGFVSNMGCPFMAYRQ